PPGAGRGPGRRPRPPLGRGPHQEEVGGGSRGGNEEAGRVARPRQQRAGPGGEAPLPPQDRTARPRGGGGVLQEINVRRTLVLALEKSAVAIRARAEAGEGNPFRKKLVPGQYVEA